MAGALADRIAFPHLPAKFAKPIPSLVADVNEFMASAEMLDVNIAELRWLCQQDGSFWLDAARVMRAANEQARKRKKGAVTVIGNEEC
jgi:hypothetical protein